MNGEECFQGNKTFRGRGETLHITVIDITATMILQVVCFLKERKEQVLLLRGQMSGQDGDDIVRVG